MPIFTQSLQVKDTDTEQEARKKMVNHIRQMQEQLEYTLLNLDSSNITEIDTDKTTITGATVSTGVGTFIDLTGENGERVTAGVNPDGAFEFSVNGKRGKIYINSSGEMVITEDVILTVVGGEW